MLRKPVASWTASLTIASLTLTSAGCPDIDGDGAVNQADLLGLLSDWGPCENCPSDLNQSGRVDIEDLLALLVGWGDCPDPGTGPFNYGEALQKAILFYEAQRAGTLPESNRLNWRDDCFTAPMEQENGTHDVSDQILNRYMDAGDTPTFVLPISSAMTLLSWSGIDFAEGWSVSGQTDELLDTVRWHADWCISAHPSPDVFCGQIGQGGPSHGFWGPPEIHSQATGYAPKIWWLDPSHPGSEPAGEAAAFMAAASMLFQSHDAAYSEVLLQHARELYAFADQHRGSYVDSIPGVSSFYNSFSGYHDELAWAATWLYRATGETGYLDAARLHFSDASPDPFWAQSWDGKINGTALLLASLTGEVQFLNRIEQHLDYWLPGGGITYTDGGLAWLDTWGSLRYAANTSFMALMHAELNGDPDGAYRTFAESQINYILGNNPRSSSYLCGFGHNPPKNPHHRGAHGSWRNDISDEAPNRHELWGALVGGPASSDDFDYQDDRSDYIANEVACDYNAGMTAALAHMARTYGGIPLPDDQFPPAEDSYGKEIFVAASIIDDAPSFTRIRCLLNNRSAWPARWSDALSFRIFIDLSEVFLAGLDTDDVRVESGFLSGGSLGPLTLVNPATHLYSIEVSYSGVSFGPGLSNDFVRESQILIGLDDDAPDHAWNAMNDPSLAMLPHGQSAVIRTADIPTYEAGALLYGDEGVRDCNGNGIDDSDEISGGQAEDADGNGIPDECDPDCNGDGIIDAIDFTNGATDCNNNGTPDSCDITHGDSSDQDGDGIPDDCQLEGLNWRFMIDDQWAGGFTSTLRIENNAIDDIDGWLLECQLAFDVVGLWPIGDALWTQGDTGILEVQHEPWNATIPAGGTLEIGMQGTGSPSLPTQVLLNGIPVEPLP